MLEILNILKPYIVKETETIYSDFSMTYQCIPNFNIYMRNKKDTDIYESIIEQEIGKTNFKNIKVIFVTIKQKTIQFQIIFKKTNIPFVSKQILSIDTLKFLINEGIIKFSNKSDK